jgi:hypothetical protein
MELNTLLKSLSYRLSVGAFISVLGDPSAFFILVSHSTVRLAFASLIFASGLNGSAMEEVDEVQ